MCANTQTHILISLQDPVLSTCTTANEQLLHFLSDFGMMNNGSFNTFEYKQIKSLHRHRFIFQIDSGKVLKLLTCSQHQLTWKNVFNYELCICHCGHNISIDLANFRKLTSQHRKKDSNAHAFGIQNAI